MDQQNHRKGVLPNKIIKNSPNDESIAGLTSTSQITTIGFNRCIKTSSHQTIKINVVLIFKHQTHPVNYNPHL